MLLRPSMITVSLSPSVPAIHKACLMFLEYSQHAPTSGPLHWMFSAWNSLPPDFCIAWSFTSFKFCLTITFTVKPTLTTLFKNSVPSPRISLSPFHTLFSPVHLSPSNLHYIFPYFGLIVLHCQNVSSTRARIFLFHCYVPSTWHVVGT